MSNMISVASGFQYSVNIGYDLNNDEKLKNFIPTRSALTLLEDILLSTKVTSTERARVLIGAYGKGKSHIILIILSMLMKKDLRLFEKLIPALQERPKLYQCVQNYYESQNKLLPVVITGSNTSLPQAFLLALQRTLAENEMLDIMPETNYKAAAAAIWRWQKEFPDTYQKLRDMIDEPVDGFVEKLVDYDVNAYEKFEKVYPLLTAGSIFNPFLGFDVTELYESAVKGLRSRGYTGIYVVYDEFSKFLEANISEASMSDTKMLQDFAEKCNRSGEYQMHLMLISHKEISNYIDTLPKQKVDGWRGVSDRFLHIHLNNNFSQTYEVIASVIQKNSLLWKPFCAQHQTDFEELEHRFSNHPIFTDVDAAERTELLYKCYPLHPVSTFVLPRLSERVAQNERTLFTFLSANCVATLPAFLKGYDDKSFEVITPDLIYDYFEPLLRKEVYAGEIHKIYTLTTIILEKLQDNSLDQKIVKTLALIYILEQFEKLKPTKDELVAIFSVNYQVEEIKASIQNLIEKEYVIYLKRSNDYLRLKETSGVDIHQQIQNVVSSIGEKIPIKKILNDSNFDSYVYPSRYNDAKEMIRYFAFEFINEDEILSDTDWDIKSEHIDADGVVYAVLPNSAESINDLRIKLKSYSSGKQRFVFVLPQKFRQITGVIQEFNAVKILRNNAANDKVLFDEYEVVYEDLRDVIHAFISTYTHPELLGSIYIHMGEEKNITRKAAFTELLSAICDDVYSLTPVINNEAINRNEITSIANNSRGKILNGLLRNELESQLGLTGSGQEVSIMRSTLIRPGILCENNGAVSINLHPVDPLVEHLLGEIVEFILDAKSKGQVCFSALYERLRSPGNHIAIRKGLIPIYVATVFHEYKKELIIQDRHAQLPITSDVLLQINSNPEGFILTYLDWNPDKEEFVQKLSVLFSEYVINAEKAANSYDYVVSAMRRWYMALPKYVKSSKRTPFGEKIDKRYNRLLSLLRQPSGSHELLFEKIPEAFGYIGQFNVGLVENIAAAKQYFDNYIAQLRLSLVEKIKETFSVPENASRLKRISLSSVIQDWCESLNPSAFEQLFPDGTERCLGLFKSVNSDVDLFVSRLAKVATDLRLEDWDDSIAEEFVVKLQQYRMTAEAFHVQKEITQEVPTEGYQVSFVGNDGEAVTKRFEHTELSKRGKLLLNMITENLDSMGRSISEQEKRQVLMEVLRKLC